MNLSLEPGVAWLLAFSLIIIMKIICFLCGYFTIRMGYRLIAAGVRGEFKFSGKFGGASADLASVSPGLLFVLLGMALIIVAIKVDKAVTVSGTGYSTVAPPKLQGVPDSLTFDRGGGATHGNH